MRQSTLWQAKCGGNLIGCRHRGKVSSRLTYKNFDTLKHKISNWTLYALKVTPNRERLGLYIWWARTDLNRGPKDYAYHFGFRRPFQVCGLDYTFPLQAGRLVSTPSLVLQRAWLGIGMSARN